MTSLMDNLDQNQKILSEKIDQMEGQVKKMNEKLIQVNMFENTVFK
jgi:hypothetical protein